MSYLLVALAFLLSIASTAYSPPMALELGYMSAVAY
jgi:hypothetical protein